MNVEKFDYFLPQELIADTPVERGNSRMMIVNRKTGKITHSFFKEFPNVIPQNISVVLNSTKVIPARLFGLRKTGGQVEILLLKELAKLKWEAMIRSSKSLKPEELIELQNNVFVKIEEKSGFVYTISFLPNELNLYSFLEQFGDMPLPPYILKKRGEKRSRTEDKIKYQTIYAETPGSVAAPTAGLHFTDEILKKIETKIDGSIERVVLDVGIGTFQPVKVEKVEEHKMHSEDYFISKETAQKLNQAKKNGQKILAVGTTSVRTLESAGQTGFLKSGKNSTEIFIYPGYKYKFVDYIFTNFHLPKSTLLMMISAFAGEDLIKKAYEEAVKEKYRFYSYGDCMLIL